MHSGCIQEISDPLASSWFFRSKHWKNRIVLLLAESRKLRQVNLDVIREMTANDYSVILLSVTLPNMVIRRTYADGRDRPFTGIRGRCSNKVFGGSRGYGDTQCHYISNPGNLTDIGIVLTEPQICSRAEKMPVLR